MVQFDAQKYAYPSHRNVVYAKRGMTCSSLPIASQVGQDVLKNGGNAVDAALAMAAVLPLAEPTGNGLGSDCFVLVWKDGQLYGLNGSGVAPMALSLEKVREAGYDEIPQSGWLPVMVPGAPAAWAELRRRFGTKSMRELMEPAIDYARNGCCVPVTVQEQWEMDLSRMEQAAKQNPKLFLPWFEMFTKNGRAYIPGELFRSDDYARTLEQLADTDCESMYRGELMKKIVAYSRATGGYLTESDFTQYTPEWVKPISVNYKGYDVYEMPPNGHGITVLMALKLLERLELPSERECAESYHKQIEAIKLAFVDAKRYVSDSSTMRTRVEDMLSDGYADRRRALVGDEALLPEAGDPSCGDTVYFCTADESGMMVSFIQSNYHLFGSGVVVPGTGISLQNRGANFSLDPESDNCLAGGKHAYHTIIPGFLAKDGKPIGPFGVMGGFMQPQGHVQVLVNTIDYHMNPQESLDAPRFQWVGEKKVQLEREVSAEIAKELARRGHEVEIPNTSISMGRGEIIWRMEDGTLVGGTEARADGTIAAW